MEDVNKILEEMDEARFEEIREFFWMVDDYKRQRMSDDIAIYDRLMQGIETLGEMCEEWELLEDSDEKRKDRRVYSELLRTLSMLVQARGNLVKLMMQDE